MQVLFYVVFMNVANGTLVSRLTMLACRGWMGWSHMAETRLAVPNQWSAGTWEVVSQPYQGLNVETLGVQSRGSATEPESFLRS